jgi:hypothetical protein
MPPFPCCDLAARETITFHREYGSAFFDMSQGKFAILEIRNCESPHFPPGSDHFFGQHLGLMKKPCFFPSLMGNGR